MPPARLALRLSGLILLVGIGIIAGVGAPFWPWGLMVVALSVFPVGVARGGWIGGVIPALWLIGLGIASAVDRLAAGVIALLALTLLLRGFVRGMVHTQRALPRQRPIRKR